MKFDELLSRFDGNMTKMAASLDYSIATMYLWRRKGIPDRALPWINSVLEGKNMDERQKQELEEERMQRLEWAFQELTDKGVTKESLDTLYFETGYPIKGETNAK